MTADKTTSFFNVKRFINPFAGLIVIVSIVLCYNFVDKPLVAWLLGLNIEARFPYLQWFTNLGNSTVYFILFFLLALFFRYIRPNSIGEERFWFLCLCLASSSLLCGVLKVLFGRARPDLWLKLHEYGFTWLKFDRLHMSFPSGHTTTMMSLALGFSVLFPRYWILFIGSGVLVAVSRVLLLEHYLSDVLAAMYLTLLVVSGLVAVLRNKGYLSKIWTRA